MIPRGIPQEQLEALSESIRLLDEGVSAISRELT